MKSESHPLLQGKVTSVRAGVPSSRGILTSAAGIHPSRQHMIPSASGNLTFGSGIHPSVQKKHLQSGLHISLCGKRFPQPPNRTQASADHSALPCSIPTSTPH